jgi:predicted nucleic acid-binding Zn ribbon protein
LLTKKVCLDCEQPIQGRSDKKFCDDNCRTNFHNQQKQEEEKTIRQINSILKRNRSILIRLSGMNNVVVDKKCFIEANFNFHFCTHTRIIQKNTWTVIYDFAYYQSADEKVAIQRIVSEKISTNTKVWNFSK